MKRLWHRLMHWLGLNRGQILRWTEDGHQWLGFLCDGCRKLKKVKVGPDRHAPVALSLGGPRVHLDCGRPFQSHCPKCHGGGVDRTQEEWTRCTCCGCVPSLTNHR